MRKKGKSKGRSGFWGGILLGGVVAGAAAYFGPSLLKDWVDGGKAGTAAPPAPKAKVIPDSGSSAKPKQPPPQSSAPKPPGGIALFRRPEVAAGLAVRAGLGESYPGSLRWKKTDDLGWNSFASLNTPVKGVATRSGEENSVTSLLESKTGDRVEDVILVANIASPKGEAETLEKFRALALTYLSETGCPVTREFLDAIGVNNMETQTPEAFYALKKMNLYPACRWELSIKSR